MIDIITRLNLALDSRISHRRLADQPSGSQARMHVRQAEYYEGEARALEAEVRLKKASLRRNR